MGCFCSKGVWANDSEKLVFGTSTWDDVVLNLDNNNNVLTPPFNEIDLAVSRLTFRQSGGKRLAENYDLKEKQMFVRFEEKHPLEQAEILIFIYTMWSDLQQDSSVVEALKETKFVKSADGEPHKPIDMFDPCDALLLSLFSDEANKFPGERFISDGWLNILRKTGLQNTRDADILLKCARKVEFLGAESMSNTKNEVSLEIISLAETLMSAIFRNFDVFNGNNLFHILGKIACVPAERWFAFERGKKGVKRVLCSYSEAILLKDWSLAWCAAPILPREDLVPPEYSWEALQLRSPPPFNIVLKHLQDEGWRIKSCVYFIEEATFQLWRLTSIDADLNEDSPLLEKGLSPSDISLGNPSVKGFRDEFRKENIPNENHARKPFATKHF
ncbi:hypothetical protein Tco_0913491 [Tanacetum coccineum]